MLKFRGRGQLPSASPAAMTLHMLVFLLEVHRLSADNRPADNRPKHYRCTSSFYTPTAF